MNHHPETPDERERRRVAEMAAVYAVLRARRGQCRQRDLVQHGFPADHVRALFPRVEAEAAGQVAEIRNPLERTRR